MWRLVKTDFSYNMWQIILSFIALLVALIFLSLLRIKVPDSPIAFIFMVLMIGFINMLVSYELLNIEFSEKRLRLQSLLPMSLIDLSLMRIAMVFAVYLGEFSLIFLWLIVFDLNLEVSKLSLILFLNGMLISLIFSQRLMIEAQYLSLKIRLASFILLFLLPVILMITVISIGGDIDYKLILDLITSNSGILIMNLLALIFIVLSHLSFINRISYASTHKVEFTLFDYIASLKRSI